MAVGKPHLLQRILVGAFIALGLFGFLMQDLVIFGGHFNPELAVDPLDGALGVGNQIVILDQDILVGGESFQVFMRMDIPGTGLGYSSSGSPYVRQWFEYILTDEGMTLSGDRTRLMNLASGNCLYKVRTFAEKVGLLEIYRFPPFA